MLYNLCFCSDTSDFYLFKHDYIASFKNLQSVDAYLVNRHMIFDYAIQIQHNYLNTLAIAQITKVCPIPFEINIANAYNSHVKVSELRDFNMISNIGHCLIDSINSQTDLLTQLHQESIVLQNQIESLNNYIATLSLEIQAGQQEIQVR